MREKHAVATSPVETKEWTIEIKRDSKPAEPQFVAILVFTLDAQKEMVTGQVWDGVERRLLSTVRGTRKLLPDAKQSFMALEFKWGNVNVALSGVTVETPDTVLFTGRFRAFASSGAELNGNSEQLEDPPPTGPGDGDTGSGTGQQT